MYPFVDMNGQQLCLGEIILMLASAVETLETDLVLLREDLIKNEQQIKQGESLLLKFKKQLAIRKYKLFGTKRKKNRDQKNQNTLQKNE
jgi:hypothetical protein